MHSHWLLLTSFLDLFATSLLVPFLAIHLHSMGISRLLVGVVTSVYPTVQLFSSPAIGYCSDRCGRKQTLVLSLLLCAVTYYFLSSTVSLTIIFCCRLALGVLKHTQTLCKAIFVECAKDNKRLSAEFGAMNAAEALGFMLGPTIGAHCIEMPNGFQLLCKITAILFVVNTFIVCYFIPEENNNNNIVNEHKIKSDCNLSMTQKEACNIDWSAFWDIFLLKWFLCVSLSLFYTNYAFFVVEQIEASPSMVGYTNSFQGFISVITGLFSCKLTNIAHFKESHYVRLLYWFSILSLSLLCLGLVSNFVIFVIFLIPLSSSSTLLRIYTTEILLRNSPLESRGSVIGVENTIASIAFLLSPFICEICTSIFGASSVPFVACMITAMGAGLSAVLNATNKTNLSKNIS